MAYTHTTLSGLESDLATKLGDTSKVFWTSAELKEYLYEAMRVWNAITGFHRTRASFTTTAAQSIYDLHTELPTERAPTLTVRNLFADIQYQFLTYSPGTTTWNGAAIVSAGEVESALNRAHRRFIGDTSCTLTHAEVAISTPLTNGRYEFNQNVIQIRRAAWKGSLGKYTRLYESDPLSLTGRSQTWTTAADPPHSYTTIPTPPITIQFVPPPSADGTLDLIYVKAPDALSLASNTVLSVPDDLAWGVKWGAMAELLSKDGPASDPDRASYCTMMYKMAVEIARHCPVIFHAYSGSTPLNLGTVDEFDGIAGGWQGKTGTVESVGLAGLNLIAVRKVPRTASTLAFDIVQNAPVTSVNAQIPIDTVDMLLSFAYHLAMFKTGGWEFSATMTEGMKMVEYAGKFNDRLRASSVFSSTLQRLSTAELTLRPEMESDRGGGPVLGGELTESTERRRDSALRRGM